MARIVVHHGIGAQLLDNIVEETQYRAVNLELIHPELREAIGRFPRIPFHRRLVPMLMNVLMRWRARPNSLQGVRIADRAQGAVRVRLYRPEQGSSGAGLLWIHGGGLITGNAATNDRECAAFAAQLGIVVVSVPLAVRAYRRA